LADQFYDIHILANYTLIGLISLHILAVIVHRYIFKENILKKML
jgi:cytochrome b561